MSEDQNTLARLAEKVGTIWKQHPYYDLVEPYMEEQWVGTIWPYISGCDFSCVVDLAAGHGRNTEKLREVSHQVYIVDINEENVKFCRERFAGDDKIVCLQNDGFTLNGIPDEEVTLVYSFDAMVHFDSDVVRSYLREICRILKPGGHGFCHHSNYDKNPGGNYLDNPGWRNFMSQNLFLHYCTKEGFEIVKSQIIDWSAPSMDCLTLFRKPVCKDDL